MAPGALKNLLQKLKTPKRKSNEGHQEEQERECEAASPNQQQFGQVLTTFYLEPDPIEPLPIAAPRPATIARHGASSAPVSAVPANSSLSAWGQHNSAVTQPCRNGDPDSSGTGQLQESVFGAIGPGSVISEAASIFLAHSQVGSSGLLFKSHIQAGPPSRFVAPSVAGSVLGSDQPLVQLSSWTSPEVRHEAAVAAEAEAGSRQSPDASNNLSRAVSLPAVDKYEQSRNEEQLPVDQLPGKLTALALDKQSRSGLLKKLSVVKQWLSDSLQATGPSAHGSSSGQEPPPIPAACPSQHAALVHGEDQQPLSTSPTAPCTPTVAAASASVPLSAQHGSVTPVRHSTLNAVPELRVPLEEEMQQGLGHAVAQAPPALDQTFAWPAPMPSPCNTLVPAVMPRDSCQVEPPAPRFEQPVIEMSVSTAAFKQSYAAPSTRTSGANGAADFQANAATAATAYASMGRSPEPSPAGDSHALPSSAAPPVMLDPGAVAGPSAHAASGPGMLMVVPAGRPNSSSSHASAQQKIAMQQFANDGKSKSMTSTASLVSSALPPPVERTKTISVASHCPMDIFTQNWAVEDFSLLRKLYEGSLSVVCQAQHRKSGRHVALKIYKRSRLHEMERFQLAREICLHVRILHPYIISLYSAWKDAKYVYLALEWAPRGNLLDYLVSKGGRLSEDEAASVVVKPLFSALAFLHSQNFIHRDVKLENIIMDGPGNVKLADFGLAIDQKFEQANTRLGTFGYFAPEVLDCPLKKGPFDFKDQSLKGYDSKVDVWSAGVVTYELLTGSAPFSASTAAKIMEAIRSRPIQYPADMSPEARHFLEQALERDPQKRWTAKQLQAHPWILKWANRGAGVGPAPA